MLKSNQIIMNIVSSECFERRMGELRAMKSNNNNVTCIGDDVINLNSHLLFPWSTHEEFFLQTLIINSSTFLYEVVIQITSTKLQLEIN